MNKPSRLWTVWGMDRQSAEQKGQIGHLRTEGYVIDCCGCSGGAWGR